MTSSKKQQQFKPVIDNGLFVDTARPSGQQVFQLSGLESPPAVQYRRRRYAQANNSRKTRSQMANCVHMAGTPLFAQCHKTTAQYAALSIMPWRIRPEFR
jgi:hypothetical protein